MESLHAVEKDVGYEIHKLMKAVNVSSVSDINQINLQKLNKGPLSSFLLTMVRLFQKNIDLCKSAATKCDHLKTEQIEIQKQLIKTQNDQMDSVQESVKTEMKSWADVVKKNASQGKVLATKTVKEAVRSVNEEDERSKNLIIYGVMESEESAQGDFESEVFRSDPLYQVVKSVHGATVCDSTFPDAISAYRLGKRGADKIRPIKVEFATSSEVDIILRNAYKLKTNTEFKSVYLSPDRTKEERVVHSKLVSQMKELIKQDNSKHYFIKNNKVNCVDKK